MTKEKSSTKSKAKGKNKKKPASIEDKIMPVSEVPSEFKALFYGRSGTGKTTVTGTFPTPSLIIDIREKGTDSVRAQKGVDTVLIESWTDFEELYYFLAAGTKYVTIAIDTVTALQQLALTGLVGNDAGLISKQTWGKAASLMNIWIMNYRDLEGNIVFLAQDRENKDEDNLDEDETILPEIGPWVMPSVSKTLNACTSIIGQTFINEKVIRKTKVRKGKKDKKIKVRVPIYCMRLRPHVRYTTKFRRDPHIKGQKEMPEFIEDPSFAKLVALKGGDDVGEE